MYYTSEWTMQIDKCWNTHLAWQGLKNIDDDFSALQY